MIKPTSDFYTIPKKPITNCAIRIGLRQDRIKTAP
jgi:hypothetical protein